jgi:adenosylhomocysteine nucleosidase
LSQPTLGFVVALPNEWKYFRHAFNHLHRGRLLHLTEFRGCFAGMDCVILLGGVGRENAANAARVLVEHHSISAMISLGYTGALSPVLVRGDIILSAYSMTTGSTGPVATTWELELEQNLHLLADRSHEHHVHVSPLLTADHIVARQEEKRRLFEQTGAEVVDMESISLFKVAREERIPFLGIHAVTDTAEEDIPALEVINPFLESKSLWRYPNIFWDLIRHPRFIYDMAVLNHDARMAGQNMAHFLRANESAMGDLIRSCIDSYPGSSARSKQPRGDGCEG